MPELDINASADEVVALLDRGQAREAAARLDALRQDQATVVQEALDRTIATRAEERLATLRGPEGLPAGDAATVQPMLDRLAGATAAPRFPANDETASLSQAQQHDVYASIVATRGEQAARDALDGHDRVILGLRNENQTTENRGRGVYDDRIVVLWRDADGTRHAREFNDVSTEPTAQYDGHAKTRPRSPGYEDVATRPKTEGDDVNGDRVADLGRLAEGTTAMRATTHPRHNHPDEFALRPTTDAVNNGQRRVERDTNADGWFDARDVNGVQALNDTFKIHRGSNANTDSAGCQTIGGGEFDDFRDTVRGTPGQDRWQYVLTSVAPGQAQVRARDGDAQAPAAQAPANDPRNPQHPDHALQVQISTRLQALGGRYAENADAYSLSLLHDAKANGVTRVDQIVTSNATGTRAEGETVFLVQGRVGDPAALRVPVSAAELGRTSVDASLERLGQQQQQAAPSRNGVQEQVDAPVQQVPSMGGR
jgi:hypothetical protein